MAHASRRPVRPSALRLLGAVVVPALHGVACAPAGAPADVASAPPAARVAQALTPADGLIAHWTFDEGAGTTAGDATGLGHTGTLANGVAWTTDARGGAALRFDGTNDRVNVAYKADLNVWDGFTVAAWVKPEANAGWRTVLFRLGAGANLLYALYASSGAQGPSAYGHNGADVGATQGAPALPVGEWTHLAATLGGGTLTLWRDGVAVASAPLSGPLHASTRGLQLGGNSVSGEYFKGVLDDVRLYGRALVPAEVAELAGAPLDLCAGVTCVALDGCHDAGVCEPATGLCSNPAKADGAACDDALFCTEGDTCQAGVCVGGAPRDCDDSNACTTDTCLPSVGCVNTAVSCGDANACTIDACNPAVGCTYTPVLCNDGNACTTDACNPAVGCVVTAISCDDANLCTHDACEPATGCTHADVSCADANACTADSCNPATGCVNAPVDCGDGNACTTDACHPVTGCSHVPVSCADSNACTVDSCNPATGCSYAQVQCNDGNACTVDSCDPSTGCQVTPLSCSDGNACTIDSCNPATGCGYAPVVCDDGDVCTDDACNPSSGTCAYVSDPTNAGCLCSTVVYQLQGQVTCAFYNNLPGIRFSTAGSDEANSGGQCYNAAPLSDYIVYFGYTTIPQFDDAKFRVNPPHLGTYAAGARLTLELSMFAAASISPTVIAEISKTSFSSGLTAVGPAQPITLINSSVRTAVFDGTLPFSYDSATETLFLRFRTTVQTSAIVAASAVKLSIAGACP